MQDTARPARSPRLAGTAIFAVAFVVLGLPDFGHGVAWPAMRDELDRPLADLGTYLTAAAAGYLLVAMATGRLAARWGVDGLVRRCTLSSALGLAAVAVAPVWPLVLLGSFLAGAGAGGMDTGFNAAVALRQDGRLMGLLHAGYGIGAALGPLVVGAFLAIDATWRAGYVVFAGANLALGAALIGRHLGEAPPQQRMGSPRGLVLPCLAFVVYVGLEVTVGQWAYTALTEERGLSELAAAAWVAVYWIALTAGRLWLGLRGHRFAVDRVLAGAVVGAVLGTTILWLGGSVAPLGLPVTGLALSVVFPLLMLLTPRRVGEERAAAAVGWQAASASVGAATGPVVAGLVFAAVGIDAYGPVALAMAAALVVVVLALEVGEGAGPPAEAATGWGRRRTRR